MIVIFSGSSGVGKNTVINFLLSKEKNYRLMPTVTTRAMRGGETEGNPYLFVSAEDFLKRAAKGEFYEYENVHGNYYGTSRKILDEAVKTGYIFLKDIDVLGTMNLVKNIKNTKILTLYLTVKHKSELVARLTGRGEKDIELRLSRFEQESEYSNKYNYIIYNYELEQTSNLIRELIAFENAGKRLLFTKDLNELDRDKIEDYAQKMKEGAVPKPVPVLYKDHKFYIGGGEHRYVAASLAGVNIAKVIDFNC